MHNPHGNRQRCEPCAAEYVLERHRAYYADPDYRADVLEQARRRKLKNPERASEIQRRYYRRKVRKMRESAISADV